jgi:hypothetical protein
MTHDLPSWFSTASWELIFNRATLGLENSLSGMVQNVDLLAWYWSARATLPPCQPSSAEAGAREAFFNTLAGGVDKVRLHHRYRPVPVGTLRGSPTLASSVAQFSDTLVLANAWDTSRQNLLLRSQEIDNAAAWTTVSGATVTAGTETAPDGTATADLVTLGATDNARVAQTTGVAAVVGDAYTYSVWLKGSGVARIELRTSTGVGGSAFSLVNLTGVWARYSVTFTVGAGATGFLQVHGVVRRSGDTATAAWMWGAQLERGAVATDYIHTTSVVAHPPVTLLAGDMLGVSPQLFQVREDAVSNTLGQMTVKVLNRTRTSLASGLPVVWNRPTAEFILPDTKVSSRYTPNLAGGHSLEFREAP